MVTCKCKSRNVNIKNLDYARVKLEGIPTAKYTGPHNSFYCHDCQSQWESKPEDWEIYYEYQSLVQLTTPTVQDMKPGGSYQARYTGGPADFDRRKELANKIIASYKHLLNLEPSVWFEIEKDVKYTY